jgi:hypothetical protein
LALSFVPVTESFCKPQQTIHFGTFLWNDNLYCKSILYWIMKKEFPGNTPYGNNIKVTLNPFLADDEIIAYNPEYVNTVIWRPTKVKDVSKDVDGTVKEIITELTLRVEHEFALSRLKNLAV